MAFGVFLGGYWTLFLGGDRIVSFESRDPVRMWTLESPLNTAKVNPPPSTAPGTKPPGSPPDMVFLGAAPGTYAPQEQALTQPPWQLVVGRSLSSAGMRA